MKSAHLSCDVYNSHTSLMRSYIHVKPRILSLQGEPFALAICEKKHHANNLYMVFRGCKDIDEVVECINTKVKKPFMSRSMYVNTAFWEKYESLKDDIEDVIHSYENIDSIVFAGHSLGGAMAQLAGTFGELSCDVTCHTYGAPYVGDHKFKRLLEDKLVEHKRCTVKQDIIPKIKFNPRLVHNGSELELESVSKMSFPLNIYDHHTCINYLKCLKQNGY